MAITQTVDIPANHRLVMDVPREIPAGPVILTFTPAREETLTVLKRTRGAWAANPWLTALDDIRAERDACAVCDPWTDYPAAEETGGNG